MPSPLRIQSLSSKVKLPPGVTDGIIMDPARQLLDSRRYSEVLGQELVTNGNFDDFTIDVSKYSPTAYWVLSQSYHDLEGTGKQFYQDLSGNGHDLTVSGGIENNSEDEDSPIYNGVKHRQFDGVNDRLMLYSGETSPMNLDGNFSYFATIRCNNLPSWRNGIVHYETPLTSGFRFGLGAGGDVIFWTTQSGGSIQIISNTVLDTDSYYTVGFTLTNNGADYTAKLYINGILEASQTGIYVPHATDKDFFVGSGAGYFGGVICDVSYFNRVLTDQEAKELGGLAKGWDWHNDNGGTFTNNGFKQHITTTAYSEGLSKVINTTAGKMYKFEGDVTYLSGGVPRTWDSQTGDVDAYTNMQIGETKHFERYFRANGGITTLHLKMNGVGTAEWDNIKVREVTNATWDDGTLVKDYSTNGHNGLLVGGIETAMPTDGYWFEMDGINDKIDFGTISELAIGDGCILGMFWIQTALNSTQTIISTSTSQGGYHLRATTNAIRLDAYDSSAGEYFTLSTSTYYDNSPHLVSFLYDAQTKFAYMSLDATMENSSNFTLPVPPLQNGKNIALGAYDGSGYSSGLVGKLGVSMLAKFASLPNNYKDIIQNFYNQTKSLYL